MNKTPPKLLFLCFECFFGKNNDDHIVGKSFALLARRGLFCADAGVGACLAAIAQEQRTARFCAIK
ncbi:MAG: hypothetical protein IPL35_00205 [Sphingobacteriales bacterium]|nr:hypothetical protein [Sphingobacteriales bacterium]